jgi:hypothetical protein
MVVRMLTLRTIKLSEFDSTVPGYEKARQLKQMKARKKNSVNFEKQEKSLFPNKLMLRRIRTSMRMRISKQFI